MPKRVDLVDKQIRALAGDGLHACGGGLYVEIKGESRRWVFRGEFNGARRTIGMGSTIGPDPVSLTNARALAAVARHSISRNEDPVQAVRDEQVLQAGGVPAIKVPTPEPEPEPPKVATFGEVADNFIQTHESGFRNEKHRYQWRQTLGDAYCAAIRSKPVDAITTEDVLEILKPHWTEKQETASRLRGRIEKVLDAAKARGLRSGENPARWRGHLDHLLPRRQKLQRGHHPAMAYDAVPALVGRLRARDALAARALEFLILTAARAGEVLGATWDEIDITAKVWTIPAERMKAGKEHRVPLTDRTLTILQDIAPLRESAEASAFVFPGGRRGRPLSNMAFKSLLDRMGEAGFVPHGFRSSFRDWCGECTSYPREIAEAALAHTIGNSVEQAYRRGDALEKRRALMDAWAGFIEPRAANVIALIPRAAG